MTDLTALATMLADTIRDLDAEIQRAHERRAALHTALAALGLDDVLPAEPWRRHDGNGVDQATVAEQFAVVDAEPVKRTSRPGTIDWAEVAAFVQRTKADGTYTLDAVRDRFGSAAKNWRVECGRRGLIVDPAMGPTTKSGAAQERAATTVECPDCHRSVSLSGLGPHRAGHRRRGEPTVDDALAGTATDEPITRAPFDPDKAREAAALVAAPEDGRSAKSQSTGYAPATTRTPTPRDVTLRYSVEDAREDIEGAA